MFCRVGRTLEQVCDVARRKQMKGFERHQYDLVFNMVWDRKPMENLWDGCDVVIVTGSDHNASCHILDSLQLVQ